LDKKIFSLTVPGKTQTYIAALKPIIAIINGETARLVLDNNIGLHAEPADIQMISKVFQQCIEMPLAQKEKLISNNQKLLESTFNKEQIVNNFVKAILEK
jgi:glycosyltransferase involved in cell wall biosynthesis